MDLSYRDLADRVQDLSLGLLELGVVAGDKVAILSENRPDWAVADYACLAAGCPDVPIYPTLPSKQTEYILRDAAAVVILVSSPAQVEKLLAIRERLPALRHIIAFDAAGARGDVLTLEDVMARGRAARAGTPVGARRH